MKAEFFFFFFVISKEGILISCVFGEQKNLDEQIENKLGNIISDILYVMCTIAVVVLLLSINHILVHWIVAILEEK